MILTEENFKQEIESDMPVLIDFWATWCPPCNSMNPIMEKLEKEFEGRVKIGKVNIEEESNLALEHGISAIPAFMLFKGGKLVKTMVGFQMEKTLRRELEISLGGNNDA
jgi:thioredoxin 1